MLRRITPKSFTRNRVEATELPPPSLGANDANVLITLYVTPDSPAAVEFFTDRYGTFVHEILDGVPPVHVELIPVAPEAQHWVAATSMEIQQMWRDAAPSSYCAELTLGVAEEVSSEKALGYIAEACVEYPLTAGELVTLTAKYGLDESTATDILHSGRYKHVVQEFTKHWLRMMPGTEMFDQPEDAFFFINGEPLRDTQTDSIQRAVRSMDKMLNDGESNGRVYQWEDELPSPDE